MPTTPEAPGIENYIDPAVRSVHSLAADIQLHGAPTPKRLKAVADSERTHAVEVVVASSENGWAIIPRYYDQVGGQLYDEHGDELVDVANNGVTDARLKVEASVPGAGLELERRKAERSTIDKIIDMPLGTVCVETSAAPLHWSKEERSTQGYDQLCQTRVTYKKPDGKITQFVIVTKSSDPEFLKARQRQLGIPESAITTNADDLLASPQFYEYVRDEKELIEETDRDIMVATINSQDPAAVGNMALRGLKRGREVWAFAKEQKALEAELLQNFIRLAMDNKSSWKVGANYIRTGYWTLLEDRYNGDVSEGWTDHPNMQYVSPAIIQAASRIIHGNESSIFGAAERAASLGRVFAACGNLIVANSISSPELNNLGGGRLSAAANRELLERSGTYGACEACGTKGDLYGCGVFCRDCNKDWCDEEARSGKQLSYKELAKRRGRKVSIKEKAKPTATDTTPNRELALAA